MGKVAGGIGLAATGTAASVGAVYLAKRTNFDSSIPDKLDDFEKDGHLEGCVSSLFPSLEKMSTNGTIDDQSKVEGDFFGSKSEDKKESESCLVINWNKQEFGTDNKWKGNFRFLWSAKNEKAQKGFVVFAVATPTSSKKFKWSGTAYFLEKTNEKWTSQKKLSISDKEVDPNNNKFPTPKTPTPKYWGFASDMSGIMDKVCSDNDCNESPVSSKVFEGYWTWRVDNEETDKDKLGEWTDHLCDIWKEIFGDDKWKMAEVVKDIKGTWKEEVWYGVDKEQTKST